MINGLSIFLIPAIVAMGFIMPQQDGKNASVSTTAPSNTISAENAEPPSTKSKDLNELIDKYFPEDARQMARKISSCESSGNEKVIGHNRNGTTDSGYFQINSIHKGRVDGDVSKLLDGETNVRVASEIYKEQSWTPWVCYRKVL